MKSPPPPAAPAVEDASLLSLLLSPDPSNVAVGLALLKDRADAHTYVRVLNLIARLDVYPEGACRVTDFLDAHYETESEALDSELDFLDDAWSDTVADAEDYLAQMRRFDQHLAAYQRYASINPAYGTYFIRIIRQYSRFELYPQAAAYCSLALRWATEKAPYWHELSRLLYAAPDAAHRQLLYLRKAVQSSGVRALHCYELAQLYWEAFKDEAQALHWARRALELSAGYPAAHHLLGSIHHAEGRFQTARHHLREALLLDAHNPTYRCHFEEVSALLEGARGAVPASNTAARVEADWSSVAAPPASPDVRDRDRS